MACDPLGLRLHRLHGPIGRRADTILPIPRISSEKSCPAASGSSLAGFPKSDDIHKTILRPVMVFIKTGLLEEAAMAAMLRRGYPDHGVGLRGWRCEGFERDKGIVL